MTKIFGYAVTGMGIMGGLALVGAFTGPAGVASAATLGSNVVAGGQTIADVVQHGASLVAA